MYTSKWGNKCPPFCFLDRGPISLTNLFMPKLYHIHDIRSLNNNHILYLILLYFCVGETQHTVILYNHGEKSFVFRFCLDMGQTGINLRTGFKYSVEMKSTHVSLTTCVHPQILSSLGASHMKKSRKSHYTVKYPNKNYQTYLS